MKNKKKTSDLTTPFKKGKSIAVYGLSLNCESNVQNWLRCTNGASKRIVFDLGSNDKTTSLLEEAGVELIYLLPISRPEPTDNLKNRLLKKLEELGYSSSIAINVDVWETTSNNFIKEIEIAGSDFLAFKLENDSSFERRGCFPLKGVWKGGLTPLLEFVDNERPMLLKSELRKETHKPFLNYLLNQTDPKSKDYKELILRGKCLSLNEDFKASNKCFKKAIKIAKKQFKKTPDNEVARENLINATTYLEKNYYLEGRLISTLRTFNHLAKMDGEFRTPYIYVALILAKSNMYSYALSVCSAMTQTKRRPYESELPTDLYQNIPQALLVHLLWITGEKDEAVKGYGNLVTPSYFENKYSETAEELLKYKKEKEAK